MASPETIPIVDPRVREMIPSDPRIQVERHEYRNSWSRPSIKVTNVRASSERVGGGMETIWDKSIFENSSLAALLGFTITAPFFRKRLQRAINHAEKVVEREALKAHRMFMALTTNNF